MSDIPHNMLEEMSLVLVSPEPVREYSSYQPYTPTTMSVVQRIREMEDDFGTPPEVIRLKNMEPSTEEDGTWTRCCPICKELMIKRHPPTEEVMCTKCGKYIWR